MAIMPQSRWALARVEPKDELDSFFVNQLRRVNTQLNALVARAARRTTTDRFEEGALEGDKLARSLTVRR